MAPTVRTADESLPTAQECLFHDPPSRLGTLNRPGFPRWALASPSAISLGSPEHVLDSGLMPLSRSKRGDHMASAHFYDDPINLAGLRPLPRPCIPSTVSWIGPGGRRSEMASTRSKLDEIVASFATLDDPRSHINRRPGCNGYKFGSCGVCRGGTGFQPVSGPGFHGQDAPPQARPNHFPHMSQKSRIARPTGVVSDASGNRSVSPENDLASGCSTAGNKQELSESCCRPVEFAILKNTQNRNLPRPVARRNLARCGIACPVPHPGRFRPC